MHNLWKVRHALGDFDDGLQQCALVFVRCNTRYEKQVNDPAWFMALFKRAVQNEFITLANKDSRLRSAVITRHGVPDAEALESVLLASASMSTELRSVVSMIANGPREMLELLCDCRPGPGIDEDDAIDQRWRRISKAHKHQHLVRELKDLLEGSCQL